MVLSVTEKRLKKSEYQRIWRANNSEACKEYERKRYAANPEQKRKAAKSWRDSNLERARENARQWKLANGRNSDLKSKYGLTLDQWNEMFGAQGNGCAICKTTSAGAHGYWATDHCHKTNAVRGILCNHCNVVLGYVKDNPETLIAAADYLKARACRGVN